MITRPIALAYYELLLIFFKDDDDDDDDDNTDVMMSVLDKTTGWTATTKAKFK